MTPGVFTREHCVIVRGISPLYDRVRLHAYFTSRRSGGRGDVALVLFPCCEPERDTAVVLFSEPETACRVLSIEKHVTPEGFALRVAAPLTAFIGMCVTLDKELFDEGSPEWKVLSEDLKLQLERDKEGYICVTGTKWQVLAADDFLRPLTSSLAGQRSTSRSLGAADALSKSAAAGHKISKSIEGKNTDDARSEGVSAHRNFSKNVRLSMMPDSIFTVIEVIPEGRTEVDVTNTFLGGVLSGLDMLTLTFSRRFTDDGLKLEELLDQGQVEEREGPTHSTMQLVTKPGSEARTFVEKYLKVFNAVAAGTRAVRIDVAELDEGSVRLALCDVIPVDGSLKIVYAFEANALIVRGRNSDLRRFKKALRMSYRRVCIGSAVCLDDTSVGSSVVLRR